jgi:hypothetical protein
LVDAAQVLATLKSAVTGPKRSRPLEQAFRGDTEAAGITLRKRGAKVTLEFSEKLSDTALRAAFEAYLTHRAKGKR